MSLLHLHFNTDVSVLFKLQVFGIQEPWRCKIHSISFTWFCSFQVSNNSVLLRSLNYHYKIHFVVSEWVVGTFLFLMDYLPCFKNWHWITQVGCGRAWWQNSFHFSFGNKNVVKILRTSRSDIFSVFVLLFNITIPSSWENEMNAPPQVCKFDKMFSLWFTMWCQGKPNLIFSLSGVFFQVYTRNSLN